MKNFVLKNVRVSDEYTDVVVRDGVVASIGKTSEAGRDCGGARLVGGLLDIHTHGNMGHDVMKDDLADMSRFLFKQGVTSWLPSTDAAPIKEIKRVTEVLPVAEEGMASVPGFHMEGPYISPNMCGAMDPDGILIPNAEELAAIKNVKMITLAPELPGARDIIANTEAVVCLGHTEADYDIATEAFALGAKCLTHTFNAMLPLHHRKPGMVGAAFDARAYAQVICDGIHIHPSVIRILYRLFGADRLILISDAICAAGLSDGEYSFSGGMHFFVKDGMARLADGTLAGSTVTLMDCVQRAISFGIPPMDAYRMASETPATMLGLKKGKVAVGYDAEFLLLDDDYKLLEVIAAR